MPYEELKVVAENNCPVCKLREQLAKIHGKPELKYGNGDRGFMKKLAKEVKDKGWMRKDAAFYLEVFHGVVKDDAFDKSIPYGSTLPSFWAGLEVCQDCGCIYAAKTMRGDAIKKMAPLQQPGKDDPLSELGYIGRE